MRKKKANTVKEFTDFFESLSRKEQKDALLLLFVNINDSAIIDACNEIELLNNCELKLINPYKKFQKKFPV